jgi:ubiquitin carboxyl-terminal hydrolase 5/13
LVAKGNRDFSSNKQQDASEYFQFFLDVLEREEKKILGSRLPYGINGNIPTSSVFQFDQEQRYQCQQTGQVKYEHETQNIVELPIPLSMARNREEVESYLERKRKRSESGIKCDDEEEVKLEVSFDSCLDSYFASEEVDMTNPSVGRVHALRSVRFTSFPRYLMLKLGRYYVDANWQQKKIDAAVDMPDHLDLTRFKGTGLQNGEILMPDNANQPSSSTAAVDNNVIDENTVMQIVSMGFSENGARRAIIATGNNSDPEVALNWVFEHMSDPDFNEPLAPVSGGGSNEGSGLNTEAIETLCSFGYNEFHVNAALRANDNNLERYCLFPYYTL